MYTVQILSHTIQITLRKIYFMKQHSALRIFAGSGIVTVVSLVLAFLYGSWEALVLCMILGAFEIALSADNAIVNARIVEKLSHFWQQIFLTIGILIAVVGMRILFPIAIVSFATGLSPWDAIALALEKGDPETPGTYGYIIHEAHPQIAAFGGLFLLMLFLDFIFEDRDIKWLQWLEAPLAKIGKLPAASFFFALVFLVAAALLDPEHTETVLISGVLGIMVYLLVSGLGKFFEASLEKTEAAAEEAVKKGGPNAFVALTGKAAFFMFLYLEVLDASFSFDGVIGAFAITSDPVIIALGLGLIGAMFVRSITIFLVRKGTLNDYVYLDHGAHWAIGLLAGILLLTISIEVPEVITGLIGVVVIIAALVASIVRNKREAKLELSETGHPVTVNGSLDGGL
jgi:hypothetical protein